MQKNKQKNPPQQQKKPKQKQLPLYCLRCGSPLEQNSPNGLTGVKIRVGRLQASLVD